MDKERVFNQEEFAADLRDVTAHLQRVYRKHFPEAPQHLTEYSVASEPFNPLQRAIHSER